MSALRALAVFSMLSILQTVSVAPVAAAASGPSTAACTQLDDFARLVAPAPLEPSSVSPLTRDRPRQAFVSVSVAADGSPTATLFASSGDTATDALAVRQAQGSTYAPRVVNCKATPGTFVYASAYFATPPNAPHCTPDREAAVLEQASPQWPANLPGPPTMVGVSVTLAPSGAIENVMIANSSGNMQIDVAALDAAKRSVFAPSVSHCAGVASEVRYAIPYVPRVANPTDTSFGCLDGHRFHDALVFAPVSPSGDNFSHPDREVLVQVDLAPTGEVSNATVFKSSHDHTLDQEALDAARSTGYLPKLSGCLPVRATYLFSSDFPARP